MYWTVLPCKIYLLYAHSYFADQSVDITEDGVYIVSMEVIDENVNDKGDFFLYWMNISCMLPMPHS